ncbi:MAG: DUF2167 domain-containing protein [Gammaproteobacteria bacterium]|nr:DUF2167 domain-containing protein [Gammaproteobacteria bacterium]MDH4256466.1 DUF2167 domain-containing protein [Gammaproteobacteria bacterium]MDH5311243.1 DUF2167 domain-containing protein [Gammaproteobacteria bacterium]
MTLPIAQWRGAAIVLLAACTFTAQAQDDEFETLTPEEQAQYEQLATLLESLDPQKGDIVLGDGLATLRVPEDFYYLDGQDAETVLVDLWGNPPGQDVLGMLFPAQYSPVDGESWAVTIDYSEDGYVSDEDAADIDYGDLLSDMQRDIRSGNDDRVAAGYEAIELVGWAESPHYDGGAKKLYWAKELRFGDSPDTTLNYEIRALGRRGILSMTFIAATDQLAEINASRDQVLAMAEFNDGHRYTDFDPDFDAVAAYGIGALVAGKVAAKTGLLAAGLLFAKKFGVFILVGLAAVGRRVMKAFSSTETLSPK